LLSRPLRWLAMFLLLVGLTVILFARLPGSFLPVEDQGAVMAAIQAPQGSTTQQTEVAISQVREHFLNDPEVENAIIIKGFSFFGQGDRKSTRLNSSHVKT